MFRGRDSENHEGALVWRHGRPKAGGLLAWIELKQMGAILIKIHAQGQPDLHVAQFGGCQPALEKRFLTANPVAAQETENATQAPRVGDVVANQVKRSGWGWHGDIIGRRSCLAGGGKLAVSIAGVAASS